MPDIDLSSHARDMLIEREIDDEWVLRVMREPDLVFLGDDGHPHFAKAITERDGRALHVVVNQDVRPMRIVTRFFYRRLRKQ